MEISVQKANTPAVSLLRHSAVFISLRKCELKDKPKKNRTFLQPMVHINQILM